MTGAAIEKPSTRSISYVWDGYGLADELTFHSGWAAHCKDRLGDDAKIAMVLSEAVA